jgi:hypothetical protein
MHTYRISFLTGMAAGFVLGARAGRERYDQIVKVAKTITEHPAVQQAAGAVQAQATELAGTASGKLSDEVRDRVPRLARTARSKVEDHVPGLKAKNGHANGQHANGNGHRAGTTPDGRGGLGAPGGTH